jgi:hypothetical protein
MRYATEGQKGPERELNRTQGTFGNGMKMDTVYPTADLFTTATPAL